MLNRPFVGSWHGLFWHRNHTGSLMAFFNMVFLFRVLFDGRKKSNRIVFTFFYLLTAVHVFGSRSAAGILIFFFLNFISLIAWCWHNFRDRIKLKHYCLFAFIFISGFIVFVSNLGFFFGLLGRSANMTGRIPLWKDLFLNFYLTKPFLGHGYGTLWMQESFRVLMQNRHGWPYQVYFADNGFLDILLNLGAVGLALFLMILFVAAYKTIQKMVKTHSWKYVFTFAILIYVVIGNLAYSFLLEVDHFVWACLLIVAFLVNFPRNEVYKDMPMALTNLNSLIDSDSNPQP
jgi:O-antigen ligase